MLLEIFDLIMRNAARSPFPFQKEIDGHLLTAEHIQLGLQNKGLNETFVYDQESGRFLIAIGDELYKKRDEIDRAIDRFSSLATTLNQARSYSLSKSEENCTFTTVTGRL
jgi:hypothetical protein